MPAALRLRFEVFNLELWEGLARSFADGMDRDRFDDACQHLLVFEAPGELPRPVLAGRRAGCATRWY